jgi:hypothetical protein
MQPMSFNVTNSASVHDLLKIVEDKKANYELFLFFSSDGEQNPNAS